MWRRVAEERALADEAEEGSLEGLTEEEEKDGE